MPSANRLSTIPLVGAFKSMTILVTSAALFRLDQAATVCLAVIVAFNHKSAAQDFMLHQNTMTALPTTGYG